ncbi:MAG: hypothetical protein AAF432_13345 [Planctomycetota bacterium]
MPRFTRTILTASCMLAATAFSATSLAQDGDFVLVDESLETRAIRVVELNDAALVFRTGEEERLESRRAGGCVAIFARGGNERPRLRGMLLLADGQVLPGSIVPTSVDDGSTFVWNHDWLGRMELPVDAVRYLTLQGSAERAENAEADVVQLANGDRLEGFVVGLGDPMALEVTDSEGLPDLIEVPLERVVSITMVTPDQPPEGSRIWFRDGTVIDTRSLRIGDDGYVRLESALDVEDDEEPVRIRFDLVSAILFSPDSLVPLSTLEPSRVEAPESRYRVTPPDRSDDERPLNLGTLRYDGPLTVRYLVPDGTRRLAAEAHLPSSAYVWGDCELVVRSDDTEVFRARLNADAPYTLINVPVDGAELTISVEAGANGPVQDVVILTNAMLLRSS